MLVLKRFIGAAVAAITAAIAGLVGTGSAASAASGYPTPWQMGLQDSASPVMDSITRFHTELLVLITVITLFVLGLLIMVVVKFNAKANPTPSRITHNTLLEVAWTVVPVLILVLVAVKSFQLLFFQLDIPPADLTVKATGKQWYWSYAYPDAGNFEFDLADGSGQASPVSSPSTMTLVVPVNKVVRVLTTGADVIHSFAVPSFGIKIDAVPGRINEIWFKAEREGIYYGQCSVLCGKDHAFMPIAVRVVSDADYATWLADAKKKYARIDAPQPTALAAADIAAGK